MRETVQLIAAIVIAAAAAACSDSGASSAAPTPQVSPVVVAFGDSLTAGFGVSADQAYPALLQIRIRAENLPHRVLNAGITGDTSADGLRRLESALVADARVLILALGANDGIQGVAIDQLRQNLSAIIERAQARGFRVLLCGMETFPTRGLDYALAFRRVFPDLAERYRVPLMPFLLEGVVGDPALNLADRFHPNPAGYRRIADNMWPHLEPLLR